MAECEYCDIIKKKLNMVYEDDQIFVMHAPKPAVFGHLLILPKKHAMIIEQLADYEAGSIFEKANKISTAVFERLGAQGTNIMLQNGVAAGQQYSHMMVHVIPRKEGDGINLEWPAKQLSEEEMSTIELKYKDAVNGIGQFEKEPPKPIEEDEKPEKIRQLKGDGENYLIKQLERIP